jgi:hypothetical protein
MGCCEEKKAVFCALDTVVPIKLMTFCTGRVNICLVMIIILFRSLIVVISWLGVYQHLESAIIISLGGFIVFCL